MADLEDVISDAVNDASLPEDTTPEVEVSAEAPETPVEATPDAPESTTEESEGSEVKSPAALAAEAVNKPEPDEFEKKYGIPAMGASGRENRIPHQRVQKIVGKAVKDTEAKYVPKIAEYETQITGYKATIQDYDKKFENVRQFEKTMLEDPNRFLQFLGTIPQYQQILGSLQSGSAPQGQTTEAKDDDPMPQPDEQLADGSMVYSLEGLNKRDEWRDRQVEKRITGQFEKRYGPIESEWQAQQRLRELEPIVNAQIAEARKWPQFVENEAEIVKALEANQNLSLERAYQQVILPKLQSAAQMSKEQQEAREKELRAKWMAELKSRPASTSAPTSQSRPAPLASGGKRSLEEIIAEQVETIR